MWAVEHPRRHGLLTTPGRLWSWQTSDLTEDHTVLVAGSRAKQSLALSTSPGGWSLESATLQSTMLLLSSNLQMSELR